MEDSDGEQSEEDSKISRLQDKIEALESEKSQLIELLSIKKGELEDYKRRESMREKQAEKDFVSDVVKDIHPIRDVLVRLVDESNEKEQKSDMINVIESCVSNIDIMLESNNVNIIKPKTGDDLDPYKHEVIFREESDSVEAGKICRLHSVGYEFDDKVIKSAQVIVSDDSNS